jgi:hypothetical protein
MARKQQKTDDGGPRGVVVRAADGRLFFLTAQDARRAAIPANELYEAYLKMTRGCECEKRRVAYMSGGACGRLKSWLDSHSPNSARWRRLALKWADGCL